MIRILRKLMMRMMGLPTCEEVADFAYDYLEGHLDSATARRFERHLEGCVNCWRFIESYNQVARPKKMAVPIAVDPDFEKRVIEFLKQQMT